MFIDASALCAVLLGERERDAFQALITAASQRRTSAIAVWETVRALVRESGRDVSVVHNVVDELLMSLGIEVMAVGVAEQALAIEAFDCFGKGRHPADLNMGDCFAYACAKASGLPLLFKGNDFGQTDIDRVV